MALIRVLLVDDHSIILDGLESILSSSLDPDRYSPNGYRNAGKKWD
jgi:DNA-binding NarL/FixJ family response regulator